MNGEADDAATPLMPDERNGLIPTYVTLRGELNELEQQNIADADNHDIVPLLAFARS